MKPSYDPKLNAAAGQKGAIDGLIVAVSTVAATAITKQVIPEGNANIENYLAISIGSLIGAVVGYAKRRIWNWRKNR